MQLTELLKRHLVVLLGISLPLGLVVFLAIARSLSVSAIPDPEHDLLFVNRGWNDVPVKFQIREERLQVRYVPHEDEAERRRKNNVPTLYYVDVSEQSAREIPFDIPRDDEGEPATEAAIIEVPELAALRFSDAQTAPDGYRLVSEHDSGGLIREIWGGRSHRNIVLRNDSRRLPVQEVERAYNMEVIGWVIDDQLQAQP